MSGVALFRCRSCGHHWQFRRALCPACAEADPEPVEAEGHGTVWSVTVVHRAPTPELDVPSGYGIALVTLDEGARVMARAPTELATGMRVLVHARDGLLFASRA
ncbi:DNA-binding protein [Phreatobacter aquaticus]|uniref:DNA-binding protein n=1 Tax=Phreatobacter aquaticus TaxID=2570229 RepID=A0A4D7QFT6_9HYPH|nr:OB-fold domain-containing protein [Phreatobacter aquaticus]QCK84354.1 DNA-binding protein [Phreatobacter aquaticus]